jgi:hypothetical protein
MVMGGIGRGSEAVDGAWVCVLARTGKNVDAAGETVSGVT